MSSPGSNPQLDEIPRRPLPEWLDMAIRRSLRVAVKDIPPRHKGLRLVRHVERRLPPNPSMRMIGTVPGGARITLNLADRVQSAIYFAGIWEPRVTQILLKELRPGDVFLDVGANVGYFALLASRRCGPAGRVHAVEPDHELAAGLRRDAANLGSRFAPVAVHEMAALDEPRTVFLVEPHDAPGQVGERYVEAHEPQGQGFPVQGLPLDSILPDQKFDVAKIDVEGAELMALRGLANSIRTSKPRLILVEVIDSNLQRFGASIQDILSEMKVLGYSAVPVISRFHAPMMAFRHYVEPQRDVTNS